MRLSLSNLSVGYKRCAVISNLNMLADEHELIALIGRNGEGKSTLLRTIARLQPAISGNITVADKPLEQYSRSELAGVLSIVSTESVVTSYLTVRQLVAFGRFPHTNWLGRLSADDVATVEEAMRLTNVAPLADKNMYEISDGERQRAMIARTLAQDTALILLDEPTAFLDMPNKYEIVNLLHCLTRTKGKTILFSTHDLNIAMQYADKILMLIDGVLYEDSPEDMALNSRFARMFEGTNLHFDNNNGQFNIKRNDMKLITVAGEGKIFFWTKKAMERLGYDVRKAENDEDADIVICEDKSASVFWTVNQNGKQLQFNSIYELSKYL